MLYAIKNRFTAEVIFNAEIEANESTPLSVKLGLAVKLALKSEVNLFRANLSRADLSGANLSRADLSGADLSRANLSGAGGKIQKISKIRVFTGLYKYQVWSVLFQDGSRWVRMGCLFKSLEEWEKIGIRKSNENEFPDNGSPASEERAIAFEFAKAAVLKM